MTSHLRPKKRNWLLGLASLALTAPISAQQMGPQLSQPVATVVEFPLEATTTPVIQGTLEFTSDKSALVNLMGLDHIQMTNVPLPDGELVVLNLQQNGGHSIPPLGLIIDDDPVPHDPLDQTMWAGHVDGHPDSIVFLSFASHGSYGWIYLNGDYTHLSSFAGPGNDWSNAGSRLASGDALRSLGAPDLVGCSGDVPGGPGGAPQQVDLDTATTVSQNFVGAGTLECKIAIETDYEYWAVWGDSIACVNYTNQLMFAASLKFFQELDVSLTYPYVQLYTTPNDPWSLGIDTSTALDTFVAQWGSQTRNGANLAHFLSGRSLGGGIAYIGTLCGGTLPFGVSGSINGGVNFPISQASSNWDFVVFTHEIGHNFNSLHTHQYCPPIDTCSDADATCVPSTNCTDGFIMSYCHTCGLFGGVGDIIPSFGSQIAIIMRNEALQCLPSYVSCSPDALEPNDTIAQGTPISPGFYGNLNFCTTDSTDIYYMVIPPGKTVTADIHFVHSTWGNIEAIMYDQGGTPLSISQSSDDHETLVWTNPTGANQPVRLWLNIDTQNTNDRNNDYSMDIAICEPDVWEPNNTLASATILAPGTYQGLDFCSTDNTDICKTVVGIGELYTADVLFPHSLFTDINADLFSANGTLLDSSRSMTSNESVQWLNTTGQVQTVTLWLNIEAVGPPPHYNTNTYDLVISKDNPNISVFCDPANINSNGLRTKLDGYQGSGVGSGFKLIGTEGPVGEFGYMLIGSSSSDPGLAISNGRLCVSGSIARYNVAGGDLISMGIFDATNVFENISGTSTT
ncbi:MAG: zinc-dependent metalloprotease, partial [Planctomycetota bacterium]|nr:zinc-dependent metalloprotease [Planctomycetota bacterium]